ncbi:MAG: hypothetical protein ACYDDG_16775, partial [Casimicrobiaceae bacterium]
RLRGGVGFLHLPDWLWHTVSYQTTWYASHTKLLTSSSGDPQAPRFVKVNGQGSVADVRERLSAAVSAVKA